MSSPLRLDWCSHEAAKYAVEHWHYSRSMPTPPVLRLGVWEDDRYIGAVLFSRGANMNLGKPYGLKPTEVCELTRVALDAHATPTSRVVAVALRMVHRAAPGLRLCVSFADANEGHRGTLYQAGGWVFSGMADSGFKFKDKAGRIWHPRQVSATGAKPQYGQMRWAPRIDECERIPQLAKYRYLMPLDDDMRERIKPLAKPYPRASRLESEAPGVQPGDEGAAMRPTRSNPWGITDG